MEDYTLISVTNTNTPFYFEGDHNISNGSTTTTQLAPLSVANQERKIGEFIALILMTALSALINLRVFCVVMHSWKRRKRSVSILIAHLTAVTTASNLSEVLFFADKAEFMILRGYAHCKILTFVRNALHAAIPLNVFAIIYERVSTFRITHKWLESYRSVLFIWFVAIVGSLPSFISYEFKQDVAGGPGKCKKVLQIEFQVTYAILRFLVFDVLTCIFILWALFSIRLKLKQLYILQPTPNERTRQKIAHVRFIYIYSILFILIMFPVGVLHLIFKLFNPSKLGVDSSVNVVWIAKIFSVLFLIYCVLNPLIYVWLNDGMSLGYVFGCHLMEFLCCTKIFGRSSEIEKITERDYEEDPGQCEKGDLELTRFPTVEQSDQNSSKLATE